MEQLRPQPQLSLKVQLPVQIFMKSFCIGGFLKTCGWHHLVLNFKPFCLLRWECFVFNRANSCAIWGRLSLIFCRGLAFMLAQGTTVRPTAASSVRTVNPTCVCWEGQSINGCYFLSRRELLNKPDPGTAPIRDLGAFCKIGLFISLSRERESLEQPSQTPGSQVTTCPQRPVLSFLLHLPYCPLAQVRCYFSPWLTEQSCSGTTKGR